MSRTNETSHIKWHETCKCKCRLDATDVDDINDIHKYLMKKNNTV